MNSCYISFSNNNSFPLNKNEEQIFKLFENISSSLKRSSENQCFSKYFQDSTLFASCLNEKNKTIEVYSKNFISKYEFEKLFLNKCLNPKEEEKEIAVSECYDDFENKIYKNLKEFSNILK